jgi:hypothetical protein
MVQHDPMVCGLWCYGGPPLCPACRAELERRGLLPPARPERPEPVTREPGEEG